MKTKQSFRVVVDVEFDAETATETVTAHVEGNGVRCLAEVETETWSITEHSIHRATSQALRKLRFLLPPSGRPFSPDRLTSQPLLGIAAR